MIKIGKMKVRDRKIQKTKQPQVDMDIIEYFYAATWNDITCDKKLMKLIVHNGFYKTALCDAFGIESITLTVDGKEWKLNAPPRNVESQLAVFQGKTKVSIIDPDIVNPELENINKTTPLKER